MTPLALLATPLQDMAEPVMTGASWAFMLTAWTCVIGLTVWSFRRVLGGGPKT